MGQLAEAKLNAVSTETQLQEFLEEQKEVDKDHEKKSVAFREMEETLKEYKAQKNEKGEDIVGDDASYEFMKQCSENMYLVNIVENDFIGGDLNSTIK